LSFVFMFYLLFAWNEIREHTFTIQQPDSIRVILL
jgi:hypothetical protein